MQDIQSTLFSLDFPTKNFHAISFSHKRIISSLKENLVGNTTCSEQMVYSAIATTCFGLYWPSSGFYNIEEESINTVKTVWGLLI